MKKKLKTSDITRKVFDQASAGVRAYANEHHGFTMRLKRALEERAGGIWHRQHIDMWLHDDPKKRVEPRFGAGALLIDTFGKLKDNDDKNPKPE